MSIEYCHNCDRYIDTDYDVEHFDENGKCVELELAPFRNDFLAGFLFNQSKNKEGGI